jgi:hypothetical protein
MKTIDDLDVSGKRVLLRADLNVPLDGSRRAQAGVPGVRVRACLNRRRGEPGIPGRQNATGPGSTAGRGPRARDQERGEERW